MGTGAVQADRRVFRPARIARVSRREERTSCEPGGIRGPRNQSVWLAVPANRSLKRREREAGQSMFLRRASSSGYDGTRKRGDDDDEYSMASGHRPDDPTNAPARGERPAPGARAPDPRDDLRAAHPGNPARDRERRPRSEERRVG